MEFLPMRQILHADFDAFYASVEQREDPTLRGKPVVVGGRPELRGVVASASYEARGFGVRSAMPMRTALQRCPHAIMVNADFRLYNQVSRQVMSIFRNITSLVEPLSLDEAFLDVTDLVTDEESATDIAIKLKEKVRAVLGLTISVGVASSKSVAKIASDMDKPDGLTVVACGEEREFLAPLTVEKLWGVGPKTSERLSQAGVLTVGDLSSKTNEWMQANFGQVGLQMKRLSLGEDQSLVVVSRERKSVSAEMTLATDSNDPEALYDLVRRLSDRVGTDLEYRGIVAKTVKLKLRLADYTTFTRQETLISPVGSAEGIAEAAAKLLLPELSTERFFRLVGVGAGGLVPSSQAQIHMESMIQLRLGGFE